MFRRLSKFEYLKPKTLKEVCDLLAQYNGQAKVIAGGTALIPQMKWRQVNPVYIIGLKNIPELDTIEYKKDHGLTLGPLTTIRDIENSSIIKEHYPVLSQSTSLLGPIEIRNLATIGGNLCNASPAANTALALMVLDAKIKIVSSKSEKMVPVEECFKDAYRTILDSNEIITELHVPDLPPLSFSAYFQIGTRKSPLDRAIVSVALLISFDSKDHICKDVKIALGSVAPGPMRAKKAERVLISKELDEKLMEEAANVASQEAKPITDLSASDQYKREIVKVLLHRLIKKSIDSIST
jgi:carbon-monoxide dehydrogenase medium subunit